MNSPYDSVFEPIQIGGIELHNRLFFPGHGTGLSENNTPADAHIAYLSARARGGVSLIITEIAQIEERAIYAAQALRIVSDEQIPGYRRLAERIHAERARVLVQLFHPGREMHQQPDGRHAVAWAPSEVPADASHVVPRPMSVAQIEQTIEQFAIGAERIDRAGIDGVEVVATHGFLPSQFLNPLVNLRTDDYGGSFENRLRFLRQVVSAIRASTRSDFVVGLRICADEGHQQGLDLDTSIKTCASLDSDGQLDYFNVAYGTVSDYGGAVGMISPMGGDHPDIAQYSRKIRDVVKRPVLVAGRINQMAAAADIVTRGDADMIGMVRANICDPEITNKTRQGRIEDIRVCIGCNQACIGHRHTGSPLSCIQNPVTGRELSFSNPPPAHIPKRIIVAGGGPGGMKAAAVAASRGHQVTLYERTERLGGQVLLAEKLPGRAEFGGIVPNLEREMILAGVGIVMGKNVDLSLIESVKPDTIILATGGTPYRPSIEGEEEAHIVDAWSVIRGDANVGSRVVIADWASDWIGLGLAKCSRETVAVSDS